jgi:apolipoprotein N-acyltransferase
LLLTLRSGSPGRAFALGLTTGVVYLTGTLYWITRVMAVYGALQMWTALLINALLVAYLSLFPALFALVMRRLVTTAGPVAFLASPFVWVATELGRMYDPLQLGGFPWVLLGYSQANVLPVAQLASVLGVFGVSALVASVSASVVFGFSQPGWRGLRRYAPLAVSIALVLGIAAWGGARVAASELTRAGEPIRVGLLQGNVDQGEKWDPTRATAIFQTYLDMTRQAISQGAHVVLWPESSIPFHFKEDPAAAEQVRTLAREANVPILFGSDEIERAPTRYYNSAFVVKADGTDGGVYRKIHLVPFGEYVPYQRLLFFAAPLTEAVGVFTPGESTTLLPIGDHLVSVAICYEVVYPNLVRSFVAAGSELLTTITNDAWFGPTSAPYQHFEQASMRAIENGRYLVRAANTGISGIVDPYGRVLAASPIFERAVIMGEARFLKESTFYTRTGDVFAYASVIVTLAMLAGARRRRYD